MVFRPVYHSGPTRIVCRAASRPSRVGNGDGTAKCTWGLIKSTEEAVGHTPESWPAQQRGHCTRILEAVMSRSLSPGAPLHSMLANARGTLWPALPASLARLDLRPAAPGRSLTSCAQAAGSAAAKVSRRCLTGAHDCAVITAAANRRKRARDTTLARGAHKKSAMDASGAATTNRPADKTGNSVRPRPGCQWPPTWLYRHLRLAHCRH